MKPLGVVMLLGGGLLIYWVFTSKGSSGSPFAQSTNPFVPTTVGTGGDQVTVNIAGRQIRLGGTMSANGFFTPTNRIIPAFQIGGTVSSPSAPQWIVSILGGDIAAGILKPDQYGSV